VEVFLGLYFLFFLKLIKNIKIIYWHQCIPTPITVATPRFLKNNRGRYIDKPVKIGIKFLSDFEEYLLINK
tara:strand:+ start:283 stop:495 length:213 start_codon:yes stop_codon:yes gene_type:complete